MLNVNPMPQPEVKTRFFGCANGVASSTATAPLSASTSRGADVVRAADDALEAQEADHQIIQLHRCAQEGRQFDAVDRDGERLLAHHRLFELGERAVFRSDKRTALWFPTLFDFLHGGHRTTVGAHPQQIPALTAEGVHERSELQHLRPEWRPGISD